MNYFNNFIEQILTSKSKTFLTFCFCFLVGVSLGSFFIEAQLDFIYFYFSFVLLASLLIIFYEQRRKRFFILATSFLLFGFFYYSFAFPNSNNIFNLNGQEVEFTAVVDREPDVRIGKVYYIVEAEKLSNGQSVEGKVRIRTPLYPRYQYGDKIRVKCILEEPKPFNGFRYDMYLANFGVFSICRRASVEKIGENYGNFVFKHVLALKRIVAEKVNKLWHEPYASFMAGLLYGYRGGLFELDELFNKTGVTHIVAISGFNITIIAYILLSLSINLYIPRQKAFWFISGGIILFLIFTGLSASVIRAGIMGILVLLARKLGRGTKSLNILILAAVVMVLLNPFVLVWNTGFQLSFLSTIGLIYFTPHIEKYFTFLPEFFGFKESVVSTISAIVLTLPLILYQFGRLSIIAPIANMLILGIIPWIMFDGFVSVLLEFVFSPLAEVISWAGRAGLEYITTLVRWFATLPFASVKLPISVWAMAGVYFVLFYWLWKKNCNTSTYEKS